MKMFSNDSLLTIDEAANFLKLSKSRFQRYVYDGEIPFIQYRPRGNQFFDLEDLRAFRGKHKKQHTPLPRKNN